MKSLIGRTSREIAELLDPLTDRPFRGAQVAHWVIQRGATSFDQMTNLPLAFRRELAERFTLREPDVMTRAESGDGSCKYLFRLDDGVTIEAVAIPDGHTLTLCLSSQSGCALGCGFCVTGVGGAGRDLSAGEIVGQYRLMARERMAETSRVNIVFMGMGEPLLNPTGTGGALEALFETVSPRRITVSTAGVVPGIRWLAGLPRRPKLAVSLNAPDQARRQQLMPIARRYPLPELLSALRSYPLQGGWRITFEYVLIDSFNDDPADASAFADLLSGIPSKVNLIPFNADPCLSPSLREPTSEAVHTFAECLRRRGFTVTLRRSRGRDVGGACGQLRSNVDPR
jgi:23S rRNA (adenine2503-C2)-methyltransferase